MKAFLEQKVRRNTKINASKILYHNVHISRSCWFQTQSLRMLSKIVEFIEFSQVIFLSLSSLQIKNVYLRIQPISKLICDIGNSIEFRTLQISIHN